MEALCRCESASGLMPGSKLVDRIFAAICESTPVALRRVARKHLQAQLAGRSAFRSRLESVVARLSAFLGKACLSHVEDGVICW